MARKIHSQLEQAMPLPLEPGRRRAIIQSLKAKADAQRTSAERLADWLTSIFGSIPFLLINAGWFLVWVVFNIGFVTGVVPFDPFPFGLLTMIVSLEAIFLAVFVLISQNRAAKIADLREEIDLQVDVITEEELTKLMQMVATLMKKQGIDASKDKVLQAMLKPISVEKLERTLERQVEKK